MAGCSVSHSDQLLPEEEFSFFSFLEILIDAALSEMISSVPIKCWSLENTVHSPTFLRQIKKRIFSDSEEIC